MPSETATWIAYIGAGVGLIGGGVALFNSWKAVCWKRAELANTYLKDFNNNPELVFAGRCLDWNGGKLILPESLRPYMPDGSQVIEHDRRIFAKALSPSLRLNEMDKDPRVQIYRTSVDSFLTWLCLVASALDRKLFSVADIQDVGYWVAKIQSEVVLHPFIVAYGYQENINKLIRHYRRKRSPYKNWVFPINSPFGRQRNADPSATMTEQSDAMPDGATTATRFWRNALHRALCAFEEGKRRLICASGRNLNRNSMPSGSPTRAGAEKGS
jgi:hypothetical protein